MQLPPHIPSSLPAPQGSIEPPRPKTKLSNSRKNTAHFDAYLNTIFINILPLKRGLERIAGVINPQKPKTERDMCPNCLDCLKP